MVLTLVEICLAYKPMPIHLMLTILLGLSIIKAALIVAYFMHLKFERLSLILDDRADAGSLHLSAVCVFPGQLPFGWIAL